MTLLEFIASVVGSLAWPLVVVVAVIVLRAQLRDMVGGITKLRFKYLELDFGRGLKEVEKLAKAIDETQTSPELDAAVVLKDSFHTIAEAERLAADFPEAAITLAWSAVEGELVEAPARLGIKPDWPTFSSVAEQLHETAFINDATYDVFKRMQKLRNMAVHGFGSGRITSDEAREFVVLTRDIVKKLRGLKVPSTS